MLDKNDQMKGGKTANRSPAAQGATATANRSSPSSFGRNDTPSSGRPTGSSLGDRGSRIGGGTGGNTGGAGPSPASRSAAAQAPKDRAADTARRGALDAAATATARGQRGLLGGRLLSTTNARNLANLNRVDRSKVEDGTAFGKKYGLDTGYGISLMDKTRFGIKPGVNLDRVNPSALTRMINGQLLFGKPVNIVEGFAQKGHVKGSQHYLGKALDLHAPTPADRASLITAMTQVGFTGTGTYPNLPQSVHIDLRTKGVPTWSGAAPGGMQGLRLGMRLLGKQV